MAMAPLNCCPLSTLTTGPPHLLPSSASISAFIASDLALTLLHTQCASMAHLRQLHAVLVKSGLAKDPIAASRTVAFCAGPRARHLLCEAPCEAPSEAQLLHVEHCDQGIVRWVAEEMRRVTQVQVEAFHVPVALFFDFFFKVISLELSTGIPMMYIFKEGKFIRRGSPVGPSEAGVYAYTKTPNPGPAPVCNLQQCHIRQRKLSPRAWSSYTSH